MKAGIVGAGIMGRLLALTLHNAGWDITLFDDQPAERANSCSMAAAGLLTPLSELDKTDGLIFALGQDALKVHWPAIIAQLSEPVYFQLSGSLIVAHPKDRAELTHFIRRISSRLGRKDYYKVLMQADIAHLEPEITTFHEGYYFPDEGCLDTQGIFQALGSWLRQKGIKWCETFVDAVKSGEVIYEGNSQTFDKVFDCRGLGARSHFADLRGIRGELLWLYAPQVRIHRPIRFLHPRYSLYVAPRPHSIYLIGASEIESEDFTPISVKTTLELLTAAYYLHPGFAEARILQTVTHCRPTLSNHLPRIKFSDRLIAINGLYRHGYLLAPTLANEVLLYLSEGIEAVCYQTLWENIDDNHSFE